MGTLTWVKRADPGKYIFNARVHRASQPLADRSTRLDASSSSNNLNNLFRLSRIPVRILGGGFSFDHKACRGNGLRPAVGPGPAVDDTAAAGVAPQNILLMWARYRNLDSSGYSGTGRDSG